MISGSSSALERHLRHLHQRGGDLAGDERQQPQRGAQDKNHHRLDDRRNPGGHDNRSHHVGQDHQGGDGTDLLHDRGEELPEVGLGESLPLLIAEGGDTDTEGAGNTASQGGAREGTSTPSN